MQGVISIKDIRIYAYHGCLEEEALIGGNYIVDVKIFTDYSSAAKNDNLSGTVDYTFIFEIIKREMKIRSKLIEHAADRVANALKKEIPKINRVIVRLTKCAPPINGESGNVSVLAEK